MYSCRRRPQQRAGHGQLFAGVLVGAKRTVTA
jgi:hypothetical protein